MKKNLDKLPKSHINFPFISSFIPKQNSTKPYYFQVFKDINYASPLEKQFLVSHLIDILKASFPTESNYDSIVSYYFSFPHAKSVYLIFALDKKSDQIQGFYLSIILEEYLEEGNKSETNIYTVTKTLIGIKPEYRKTRLYREISILFLNLINRMVSQRNYIHFDVVINPLVFYDIQKNNRWTYPGIIKEISKKQMEFFVRLRKRLLFTPAFESNPFLVQAMSRLADSEIQYWRNAYSNLPEEMKFFIDQTQLEKHVGVVFMAIVYLIEGNTFGLPAKKFIEIPDFEGEALEHSFINPKL